MYVNLIVCMYDRPSFCMCDTLTKEQPQSKKQNRIRNQKSKGVSNQLCLL